MGKHVLFLATPQQGHVAPTLPVLRELIRRGHQISYATGPALAGTVADAGAKVWELPWAIDASLMSREDFNTTRMIELIADLVDTAGPRFEALVEYCATNEVEAICFDALVVPVGYALAHRLGVPAISMIPSMAVNEHIPLDRLLTPDFTPDNPALLNYAGKLHAFSIANGLPEPLLPMTVPPGLPTLVFMPPAFQIAADTFTPNFHFVGPTIDGEPERGQWTPPAGLDRLLVVSVGTVVGDRTDIFAACVEAFADTDWHVVLAAGRTDLSSLGRLPANIESAQWYPLNAVLRDADAFITHAGANSTLAGLALEVPLLALPQVPEHWLNADRVADLGLGEVLDSRTISAPIVRSAIERISSDAAIRERLSWMAGEIRAAGGARAAADVVLSAVS